ncbi:MAG: hypothetical protein ACO3GT_06745 [Candidatus Nanopelagicales bacterium]
MSAFATRSIVTKSDAAFGLWPLARSWRTFPGARLSNGQGLKAATRSDVA